MRLRFSVGSVSQNQDVSTVNLDAVNPAERSVSGGHNKRLHENTRNSNGTTGSRIELYFRDPTSAKSLEVGRDYYIDIYDAENLDQAITEESFLFDRHKPTPDYPKPIVKGNKKK